MKVCPAAIELDAGPFGKPKLAPKFATSEIAFNLSHSGELAVIAVARAAELGVDVERIQEQFAFTSVAERFFTSREVAALQVLPPDHQREAFYKCWTSKEALLKAKGLGLSGSLDEVQIQLTPTGVHVISAPQDWALIELNLMSGYAAALSIKKSYGAPQCGRWDPSLLGSKHDR